MANEQEIHDALDVIKNEGVDDIVLLHCVSGYPTPIDQINLSTIDLLKKTFEVEVGLSDHTLGNLSSLLALAYDVKVIEKHFTLNREDGGPDAAFSMEPEELKSLSNDLKLGYLAKGKPSFDRKLAEEENVKFRRSLYVVDDIKKGEIFTNINVRRIRPGYGISPKFYDEIIGKKAKKDIEKELLFRGKWSVKNKIDFFRYLRQTKVKLFSLGKLLKCIFFSFYEQTIY